MTGITDAIVRTNARHHHPRNWFTRGTWPHCSCGFAPEDNLRLIAHWADLGIEWIDDHGHLEWRSIVTHINDDGPLFPEPEPGERQEWGPASPSADCIICNPLGHVGCGCNHRRCAYHADTPDPIADRPALAAAYADFHRWERVEMDAGQAYYSAGEKRAAAATLVMELGGKL